MISYGSHFDCAEMLIELRSHQLGEGLPIGAEMSCEYRPSQPIYGSLIRIAEMLALKRSHQLGKGHEDTAKISIVPHPFRPVYGSHVYHAAMPIYDRSHLFTRGRCVDAAMLNKYRLSREGSDYARRNANAGLLFPTRYRGSILDRRNAKNDAPPPDLGHLNHAAMLISKRPILTRGQSTFAAMPCI